jgi:FkbM family methyltransferase
MQYAQHISSRKVFDANKLVFLSILKSGDTVFDIGANMGYYSTFFSRLVRKEGRVFAFEPVPSTYQILQNNVIQEFYQSNITLHNLGLGNQIGQVDIYIPDQVSGQASLRKQDTGLWASAKEVISYNITIDRLDDFIERNNISNIDFIKIDIEGAELDCIKGGIDSLRKLKPKLYLEVNDGWLQKFNSSSRELIEILKCLEYTYVYQFSEKNKCLETFERDLTYGLFNGDLLFSVEKIKI